MHGAGSMTDYLAALKEVEGMMEESVAAGADGDDDMDELEDDNDDSTTDSSQGIFSNDTNNLPSFNNNQ